MHGRGAKHVICGARHSPHAGDVLNAVPMRRDFRVPTWAMRIIVQRRLGLPLDEALASGEPTCRAVAFRILCAIRRAISGAPATRQPHQTVLRQLVLIMQGVCPCGGTLVEMEPQGITSATGERLPA